MCSSDLAQRLYGYTAAEAVGQPISLIIPPDRPNEMLRILQRLERGDHIEAYETVRMRKNGTRLEVSLTVSPIRNASGKIIGASAIGRDITEEKRTQAAVQEATALRSVASLAGAAAPGRCVPPPSPPVRGHPVRSPAPGSSRAAPQAGTHAATAPPATSTAAALPNVAGSRGAS